MDKENDRPDIAAGFSLAIGRLEEMLFRVAELAYKLELPDGIELSVIIRDDIAETRVTEWRDGETVGLQLNWSREFVRDQGIFPEWKP